MAGSLKETDLLEKAQNLHNRKKKKLQQPFKQVKAEKYTEHLPSKTHVLTFNLLETLRSNLKIGVQLENQNLSSSKELQQICPNELEKKKTLQTKKNYVQRLRLCLVFTSQKQQGGL